MDGEYAPGRSGGNGGCWSGGRTSKLTAQTLLTSESSPGGTAAVDFYFIQDDGGTFKATVPYEPYFFLTCRVSTVISETNELITQAGTERTVEEWLMKRFEGVLVRAEREKKWDLYLVSVSGEG